MAVPLFLAWRWCGSHCCFVLYNKLLPVPSCVYFWSRQLSEVQPSRTMVRWSLLFLPCCFGGVCCCLFYVCSCSSYVYMCSQETSPSEAALNLSSFKFSGHILMLLLGVVVFQGWQKLLESFVLFSFYEESDACTRVHCTLALWSFTLTQRSCPYRSNVLGLWSDISQYSLKGNTSSLGQGYWDCLCKMYKHFCKLMNGYSKLTKSHQIDDNGFVRWGNGITGDYLVCFIYFGFLQFLMHVFYKPILGRKSASWRNRHVSEES